jgi:16S rRNA (adenine1518-N6/adenine1519-N6)-dimethyltransferase
VKSAVIRMIRNEVSQLACDEVLFKSVVKTSFNQRRKMMRNSLKPLLGNECELFILPVFNKRPEQLSVAQFVELTQLIEQHQKTTLQNDI